MSNQEIWNTLFQDCFSNHGSKYCEEVWPILVAVDQGIKPSFLWDVCTPDTNALLNLLSMAHDKQLLTNKLKVVEVDLDVFIVNLTSTIKVLTSLLTSDDSWLVDISASKPQIANKETHLGFREHLISLLTQLGITTDKTKEENENTFLAQSQSGSSYGPCNSGSSQPINDDQSKEKKAITVCLHDDINLSTIFGCILGYPQIYWWQGESGGSSLTGIPLKVFKFSAKFSSNSKSIELFSFSIPENLETELRPGIEQWGNILNSWVEKSQNFSEANFFCDPVLCLSVAL